MDTRRIRVFLVDRHRLVRDGVRLHLACTASFDIVGEADNACDALASPQAASADVMLADVGPHGLDEGDLATLVGHLRGTAILAMSWCALPSLASRVLRAGAKGFVLKDAPAQQLVSAVRTVASGGVCLGSDVAARLLGLRSTEGELSLREHQVLRLVGHGQTSKLIARQLGISPRTVESHRLNIKRKLNIEGPAALVKYAVENQEAGAHSVAI